MSLLHAVLTKCIPAQPVLPVSLPNNMTQEDFTAQQRNALINAISGRLLGQQVPAPEQAVPDTEK